MTPRPAATLLLLRDDLLRILMVKRHAKAFFPSALVFPGGTVDPSDHEDDWLPYLAGHKEVIEAVRRRDVECARRLMSEMFEHSRRWLLAAEKQSKSQLSA